MSQASRTSPDNDTRERILAAAAAVLSENGYAAARLSDISERASLRAPAVYYYFDSRDALFHEVMAAGQRSLLDYVTQALAALPERTSPLERLDCAVEAHLHVELRYSDFATAVTRNAGQLPAEMRVALRKDTAHYFALWDRLIAALQASGSLRDGLSTSAARMLVLGALNWTAEWWKAEHGDLGDVVRTAQIMVRGGLVDDSTSPNSI